MNQLGKISYVKGMNQDISKTKYPKDSYYVLTNGTIISGDSTDSTEISTLTGNLGVLNLPSPSSLNDISLYSQSRIDVLIKKYGGNAQNAINLYLTDSSSHYADRIDERLSIIGYCNVIDRTFLFMEELNNKDCSTIFELIIDNNIDIGTDGHLTLELLYVNSKLKFGYIGNESIGVFENENITHLYWVDGINQLRVFNATNPDYITKDFTQLDIVPEVTIGVAKFKSIMTSGSLGVGVVQYSYQYYNDNAQVSVFMPLSQMIHLTTENEDASDIYTYRTRTYHGAESNQNSGKSVEILIENIDQRFENIRIVQIFHNTISENPTIKIINEQSVKDKVQIRFIDDGSASLGSISVNSFLNVKPVPLIPKTIATKDNILFVGNSDEGVFNSKEWDNFCTRAIRFNSNSVSRVYSTESIYDYTRDFKEVNGAPLNVDWNGLDDDLSEFTVNAFNIPEIADNKPDGSHQKHQYKYMRDGQTLGGEGPNIKYKFVTQRRVLDNDLSSDTSSVGYDKNEPYSYLFSSGGIYTADYKSPYETGMFRSYQPDEVYRFAIVAYSNTGLASSPKWIADIRFPDGVMTGTSLSDRVYVPYYSANLKTYMNEMGIDFSVELPISLKNEIQGFSIVRCKRDDARHILGNGLLTPYIYGWANGSYISPGVNEGSFNIKLENANSSPSKARQNTPKKKADLVSNSYQYGHKTVGVGALHYYQGFANHSYVHLNEGVPSDDSGFNDYNYKDPITDSGVCNFICPEDLFSNNLKIHKACKVMPTVGYKVIDALSTISTGCLWGDFIEETEYIDALKLLPNTPLSDMPMSIDDCFKINPIEDIKFLKYFYDKSNNMYSTELVLVNGMVYGTNDGVALISHGSAMLISVSDLHDVTYNNTFTNALRANIKKMAEYDNNPSFDYQSNRYVIGASIKQHTKPYGGQSLAAILNSTYISTNNYIDNSIEPTLDNWFSSISTNPNLIADFPINHNGLPGIYPNATNNQTGSAVFGGDVFISMFQYLSQWGTDLTTEEITTGTSRHSSALLFPVVSTINCNLRHDLDMFTISKTKNVRNIGEKAMFRSESNLDNKHVYHDNTQKKDLYLYNTVYSKDDKLVTYTPLKNKDGLSDKSIAKIMASLPKVNGEYNDNWTRFGINPELELPTSYGGIVKLIVFKDILYSFQRSGIASISINDKTISQDKSNPLLLGTTGVLDSHRYISTNSGTNHKYSILATEDMLIYFDSVRNSFNYLSAENNDLSSVLGLNSYFNENRILADLIDSPSIISTYDSFNKNLLFRLRYSGDKEPNVLVFNRMFKTFTHFISNDVGLYINTLDRLYSTDVPSVPISNQTELFLENHGLQNNWYNTHKPLKGTFVINPTTNEFIKIYDFFEFMTTSSIIEDDNKFNVLNLPLTYFRAYNDYQDTGDISLIDKNERDELFQKNRNRTFRISRLRDVLDTSERNSLARLKDYYINIDFEFDKTVLDASLSTLDIKFTLKDLFYSIRDLKTTRL